MATKRPQDLDALRAEIARLQTERVKLQAEHRGRNEACAENAAFATGAAAEFTQRLRYAVAAGTQNEALTVRAQPDGRVNLGPMLAALLGPEALAAVLDQHAAEALPPSVDHSARAARLAEVAAGLDALEDAEEVEVCRLEALGLSPGRRADARPEIVLRRRG